MARLKLHHWILIALALGAALGAGLGYARDHGTLSATQVAAAISAFKQVGDLFLTLLKMLIVPLVVASLISGVTSMGSLKSLRGMGTRTLTFYLVSSLLAIVVGLLVVNIVSPGEGVDLSKLIEDGRAAKGDVLSGAKPSGGPLTVLWQQFKAMIPANPIAAAAGVSLSKPGVPQMLPLIFFSVLFGIFINAFEGEDDSVTTLKRSIEGIAAVMMKMTLFVVHLTPVGVFAFAAYASATAGVEVFKSLIWYVLAVLLALAIHALITLPLLLRTLSGRNPIEFAKAMRDALLTAFSTASSGGTLPLTMKCAEQNAGIDRKTTSFVLPLGATVNMDGTALYEAVAVLFIAQATGHHLELAQQFTVVITALLVSIGAAGIPHAGTVMMVVILQAVGLPTDSIYAIFAVDRVLDMARTSVNVWSDSIATAIIDKHAAAA